MSELPAIFSLESCDSVLNEARRLFAADRLPVYASVIATKQTDGRGQHGHSWESPAGNLYAAIRLPVEAPFTGLTGPMAVSTIIAETLQALQIPVKLKWPNDIVISTKSGGWVKCCGILLEKKGDLLVAGIGINVTSHPPFSRLREKAALPAGALIEIMATPPTPIDLWRAIVRRFVSFDARAFARTWPAATELRLLWLNALVALEKPDGTTTKGIFRGLGEAGEILLEADGDLSSYTEGSLRGI